MTIENFNVTVISCIEALNEIREHNSRIFSEVDKEILQYCLTLLKISLSSPEWKINIRKIFPEEILRSAYFFQERNWEYLRLLINNDSELEISLCDFCEFKKIKFENRGFVFSNIDYCNNCRERNLAGINTYCDMELHDDSYMKISAIPHNVEDCELFYKTFEEGFRDWDRSISYKPIYNILRKYDGKRKFIEVLQFKRKNKVLEEIKNRRID